MWAASSSTPRSNWPRRLSDAPEHDFGLPGPAARRRLGRLRRPVGDDDAFAKLSPGVSRRVLEGRAGPGEPGADGHDLLDRWRQHHLHALGELVAGHWRGTELLRHALYEPAGGVHQGP